MIPLRETDEALLEERLLVEAASAAAEADGEVASPIRGARCLLRDVQDVDPTEGASASRYCHSLAASRPGCCPHRDANASRSAVCTTRTLGQQAIRLPNRTPFQPYGGH